ncbi:hypothetical protein A2W14_06620 [Candidatus Gottesmanbacteria bacterium RBG_16_37_8]|uniref:HD domain-containing protein n=1 Tax=Candidatus Gottesmanbacteria bacterium RBG_16_37_8 TaxID=1798371 RepID=A0A1F5YSA2_9BACT|nr:MAG: hypothetical protein A2W14_06620 [Candidatus Gottesmanbacteria bacterium RBG_16_37_8]
MTKYKLPDHARELMDKMKMAGFECFAVGGCVRDMLLSKETKDWDFTTNATPEQIQTLFSHSFYDNKFGTVGIPFEIPGSIKPAIYEATTYRSEEGYSDHRHPDKIVFGDSLTEDLKRRDFTINALAFDGEKIIDKHNGLKDLELKLIRAVGDADSRFSEDALRMLRAVRLAVQLSFSIEKKTLAAIAKNSTLITKISGERIRDELVKILSSQTPASGIMLMKKAGLLKEILPEADKCFGVEQKSPKRHHVYDVGTHLLKSLEMCPSKDPIVRLATLLHDVGKAVTYKKTDDGVITFYNHELVGASIVRNIGSRLHFSKKDTQKLILLVRFHQFTVDERQTDSAVRRFIRNVGMENVTDILDLRVADRLGGGARETSWRLELFKKRLIEVQKQPFSVADLKVSGHDVMRIYDSGPGPLVGAVLNMLFEDVVSGKLPNEKEILLKRIKDLKNESKIKK